MENQINTMAETLKENENQIKILNEELEKILTNEIECKDLN